MVSMAAQKNMAEYQQGLDGEEDYVVREGVLYTLEPPKGRLPYPRIVVPESMQKALIMDVHDTCGHQGMEKTIARIYDTYKWPNMRRMVYHAVAQCPTCSLHSNIKTKL